MEIILKNLDDTEKFGEILASLLFPGIFISLKGELGAGKTTLTRYIAKGLGVDNAKSPSFSILNIYEGKFPIYHFDFYRLSENQAEDLGFDDYFFGRGISICEWGENIENLLPENRLEISIFKLGENSRKLVLNSVGEDSSIDNILKNNIMIKMNKD